MFFAYVDFIPMKHYSRASGLGDNVIELDDINPFTCYRILQVKFGVGKVYKDFITSVLLNWY